MKRRYLSLSMLAALVAWSFLAALPTPARAATCGTERAQSDGQVFRVKSAGTTCRVARFVSGAWFRKQSENGLASSVRDQQGRRWRCRITRAGTGTDPGLYPYTDVRCARGSRPTVVRFSLRS